MPLLNGDSVAAGCSQVPSSLGRNPFGFCCVLTGLAEDESMTDRPDKNPAAPLNGHLCRIERVSVRAKDLIERTDAALDSRRVRDALDCE